jgi:hypothetical protein
LRVAIVKDRASYSKHEFAVEQPPPLRICASSPPEL